MGRQAHVLLPAAIATLLAPVFAVAESGDFYAELFAGKSWEGSSAPDNGTDSAGGIYNGSSRAIELDDGDLYGARLGWALSPAWRFDLSYEELTSDLEWITDYPGCCTSGFTSEVESRVLLLSAYYTFLQQGLFRPYAGVGVGVARNRLDDIRETWDDLGQGADVVSGENTNFAWRLVIGTIVPLTEALQLNLELSALNTGDAESGSSRWLSDVDRNPIGKYQFEDLVYTTATAGIRYRF